MHLQYADYAGSLPAQQARRYQESNPRALGRAECSRPGEQSATLSAP